MKKKKSLLSLGILALVLVLGVGYAVVTAVDLTFGGQATVADAVIKVDIEGANAVPTGTATTTHTWTQHATSDSFTITGMALNETVTITYTLMNHETDVAANIAEKVELTNTNSEFFDATYTIDDDTIAAQGTGTVTVKVKLKKTPVDKAYNSTTVNFSVQATAADNHVAS